MQSSIHQLEERATAAGDESLGNKSTAGLASLGLGSDTRADARGTSAAARAAVGSAEALSADELDTLAVTDVLGARGVEGGSTGGGGASDGGSRGGGGRSGSRCGCSGGCSARDEATAGLASLGLGSDTRADARGTSAASRATVSSAKALSADELETLAVTDVLGAGGVEGGSTGGGGASNGGSRGSGSGGRSSSRCGCSSGCSARDEATARLASLGLGTDTRADAGGTSAASRATVSSAETLSADELETLAVTDVLGTRGVERRSTVSLSGNVRGEREERDGGEGLHDDYR